MMEHVMIVNFRSYIFGFFLNVMLMHKSLNLRNCCEADRREKIEKYLTI